MTILKFLVTIQQDSNFQLFFQTSLNLSKTIKKIIVIKDLCKLSIKYNKYFTIENA